MSIAASHAEASSTARPRPALLTFPAATAASNWA